MNSPIAVCTKCGKYTSHAPSINNRCSNQINGKRCQGIFSSAISNSDWEKCPSCSGSGCDNCQKFGVVFVRK